MFAVTSSSAHSLACPVLSPSIMDLKPNVTMTCAVKILHRWTASPKAPSKLPVKDWCKEKKPRWFVAKFAAVPSETTIKYFQKKDDWTTGSKAGTSICLSDVNSTRQLPAKDDEHRVEVNFENHSLMLIFDSRHVAEKFVLDLKTALRTYHVSIIKSPNPEVLGDYVASVEQDAVNFRCISISDFSFQWMFTTIKGLQFKSEFGQLTMELSKAACTGRGQYIFSGQRAMQFARKLTKCMSTEEERYRPLPTKSNYSSNSLSRSRTLSVPNAHQTANGVYDLPHEPRAGVANSGGGGGGGSHGQSGSDSGVFNPGPHYGHNPPPPPTAAAMHMMAQYPGPGGFPHPHIQHTPSSPFMPNMSYPPPHGMMPMMYAPPPGTATMYTTATGPMYIPHQPHPQAMYHMTGQGGGGRSQEGFRDDENIYEEIPHQIVISREPHSHSSIDHRPPMAPPRESQSPTPPLPLLRGQSAERRLLSSSSERSPVPFSSASEEEDEQEKMKQVEEAISKIAIGEKEEAEDVGYIPISPRTAKKQQQQQQLILPPEDDGYLLMYPTKAH